MVEPKSPFLPTKDELKELDRKDGFDRTPPKPEPVKEKPEAEVTAEEPTEQPDEE